MTQYIRAIQERGASSAEPGTPIRFVASTEGIGRDGLVIDQNGWDLDNFRANPAFLWSHDYTGNRPPIGRVSEIDIKDGKMIADVVFDQGDEFARQIERKYRDGFLNAVSVGWETKQIEPPRGVEGAARVTKAELLDISAVNIPGDPGALIERQLRAMQELLTLTETEQSTEPPASESWERTAAAMVDLFAPYSPRPDDEREAEYKRLAREYSRLDKTPPEFLAATDCDAFDGETLRGLFLEGEPELLPRLFATHDYRAGAVLNKRNADDLQAISDLALGILKRSTKEAETADPPPAEPDDSARALLLELTRLRAGDTTHDRTNSDGTRR